MSIFAGVTAAPPDPIVGLNVSFKEDKDSRKVNLGVGAYRDDQGKPWVLPSVAKAESLVVNDKKLDKEYAPIDGLPDYKFHVQSLIFKPETVKSGKLATAQGLSGTGCLQIVGQFLVEHLKKKMMWVPSPTWGNHKAIFKRAGMGISDYAYYKADTRGLDFDGMIADIKKIPEGDCILLHACAHNPTGVDPTLEQWKQILAVVKERKLVPVLDNAYQGYASGDLEKDGAAQFLFEESGLEYFVTQSFAKNFGLYGERIGYMHVNCKDKETATTVLSQLKIHIRQAYSSPPRHGAAIVNKILTSPDLKKQWLEELKFMSERITQMRDLLRKALEKAGAPGTWNHVTDQIGMFAFTGLNTAQVESMTKDWHIYLTKDGRISMAGVTTGNVEYIAQAINGVLTGKARPAEEKKAPAPKADKKGAAEDKPLTPEEIEAAKKAQLKKVIKEGGKRGVEIEGAADMGGLQFFCTAVECPDGDVDLLVESMKAMNKVCAPDEEERKGCSGHIGKMIFSAGVEQLAVVAYVPQDKQATLSGKEWIEAVLGTFGGKLLSDSPELCTGVVKTDGDKGIFPLKIREPMILESNNFLRKKGLFPEDNDDSDEMVFGDDDFPSI